MHLRPILSLAVLAILAACGQETDKTAAAGNPSAAEHKPAQLTVEQRLDVERSLRSAAAKEVSQIKNTSRCQPYAENVEVILSVAAEPSERKTAIEKTLADAGRDGCLIK